MNDTDAHGLQAVLDSIRDLLNDQTVPDANKIQTLAGACSMAEGAAEIAVYTGNASALAVATTIREVCRQSIRALSEVK